MLKFISKLYMCGSYIYEQCPYALYKHLINTTSTTSIVEKFHSTDYLNNVVFFTIFILLKL
jgi:hypothetical protein